MIRDDFPALQEGLVYLDSAATAQKPRVFLNALHKAYITHSIPIHRSVYPRAEQTLEALEQSREVCAQFFHTHAHNIIWTKNSTEGLNHLMDMLSRSVYAKKKLWVSSKEHNALVLPMQRLAYEHKSLLYTPPASIIENDTLCLEHLQKHKPDIVGITAMSHIDGHTPPVQKIIECVHTWNGLVIVDATQYAVHYPLNAELWGADFFVCSAHKMYGPFGVGILWMQDHHRHALRPHIKGGGHSLMSTNDEQTSQKNILNEKHTQDFGKISETLSETYMEGPTKFEAGTLPIPEIIAFQESIRYIQRHRCLKKQNDLTLYTEDMLRSLDFHLTCQGGICAATHDGYHLGDMGILLGIHNVCVRTGRLCADRHHQDFLRVSLGVYNTHHDVDILEKELRKIMKKLKKK